MSDVISLEDYVSRAREGQVIKEKLKSGSFVEFTIFPPSNEDLMKVKKVISNILNKNTKMLKSAARGKAAEEVMEDAEDVGSFYDITDLDRMCLQACLKELDDDVVMVLVSDLQPKSAVRDKCMELCGADIFVGGDEIAGK